MAQLKVKRQKPKTSMPARGTKASMLLEEKHIGSEIVDWSAVSPDQYRSAIRQCLRHYGYFYDLAESIKWLRAWARRDGRKDVVEAIQATPDWKIGQTVGSLARMITNGCVLDRGSQDFFDRRIQQLLNDTPSEEQRDEEPATGTTSRKSPTVLVKENGCAFIAEIESYLDQLYQDEQQEPIDVYTQLMAVGAPALVARMVNDYYTPLRDELMCVLDMKDRSQRAEELREGYRHLTKQQLKQRLNVVGTIVSDSEKYLASKQATRKTRTKKAPSAAQQASSLKYQKSADQLKVVSVSPEKVVGAKAVVLFDTSTRVITWLVADDQKGLSVRRTTIHGFDEHGSVRKRVRNPDELIASLGSGTRANAAKTISAVKTKPLPASGRTNDNTLIIRVFG